MKLRGKHSGEAHTRPLVPFFRNEIVAGRHITLSFTVRTFALTVGAAFAVMGVILWLLVGALNSTHKLAVENHNNQIIGHAQRLVDEARAKAETKAEIDAFACDVVYYFDSAGVKKAPFIEHERMVHRCAKPGQPHVTPSATPTATPTVTRTVTPRAEGPPPSTVTRTITGPTRTQTRTITQPAPAPSLPFDIGSTVCRLLHICLTR